MDHRPAPYRRWLSWWLVLSEGGAALAPSTHRTSPGGLSPWPRILFLGTAALAFAVLVGLSAYGLAVDKEVSPPAAGMAAIGIFTVGPGLILARLASAGEANPRRTTGIWIALLSYIGFIATLTLWLIGDAIWQAGGHTSLELIGPSDPMPAGLVDSTAGTFFGIGLVALAWLALPVFVLAGLYTLWACWRKPHQGSEALLAGDDRGRSMASGFEVGAAVTATLLAALGLADAVLFHYALGIRMPVWSEGGRVAVVGCILGLAGALVAVGTALHLRGWRGGLPGRALLWIGAVVLTVAGVLDSFSATSLSGTTGTYAASTISGGLFTHWVGLGSWLLPAGVVALLLAISVTHLHLPLPNRGHHTPALHAT